MRTNQSDHEPYIEHGEKRSRADHVPHPASKEAEACNDSKDDQEGINNYLYLGERLPRHPAYGYLNPFSGHCDGAASDFKRYGHSKDGTPESLSDYLMREAVIRKERRKPHIDVKQNAEDKTYDKLKELDFLKMFPQDKNLGNNQNYIHDVGIASDCEQRGKPSFSSD